MKKKAAVFVLAIGILAASLPVYADDNVQILTHSEDASEESWQRIRQYLRVTLDENPVAAQRITEGYQVMYLDKREAWIREFMQEEEAFLQGALQPQNYVFGDDIVCKRADSQVVSVRAEYWRNTGGPHPNSEYHGAVFSSQNGQLLSLSNLLIGDGMSGKKLIRMLENRLEEQFGEYIYEFGSVSEYAAEAFAEQGSWYLTEDSLVFMFDPDEIAPYAAGLIEVKLPYTELGEILQVQYLESTEQVRVTEYGWADGCLMLWNDVLKTVTNWLDRGN